MPDIVTAERLAEIEERAEASRKHRGMYWDGDIPDLCATVRKLERELSEERARYAKLRAVIPLWMKAGARSGYVFSIGLKDFIVEFDPELADELAAIDAAGEKP